MDMVLTLETAAKAAARRSLPDVWRDDRRFTGVESIDQLISAVRGCDARSDELLTALVDLGPDDPVAPVVVLAALMRFRAGLCRGEAELLDALAGDLAVVLAEAWRGELPPSNGRRLANVMADRAWGRVKNATLKGRWLRCVPIDNLEHVLASPSPSADDCAVDPLAVHQLRHAIGRVGGTQPALLRAWSTAVELHDRLDRSLQERNQWQYARRVLLRHVTADFELVDL